MRRPEVGETVTSPCPITPVNPLRPTASMTGVVKAVEEESDGVLVVYFDVDGEPGWRMFYLYPEGATRVGFETLAVAEAERLDP